jgi:osmoprotectant transport system ATP-binding protein
VRKTIIFVTHDIDEAIKMGDRIAIMREGRLVQIAPSDEILAKPADEFVASFVGVDRGLKRLRVHTLRDIELQPGDGDTDPQVETVKLETTLHDTLSLMLANGTTELRVLGDDGQPAGTVRFDTIARLLAPEPTP